MLKYKVLNEDMKSPFQNFQFEIGKEYVCENFDTSETECAPGFYATDIEGIIYSLRPGKLVFLVEVGGKEKKFDEFKHRFETQRLIREIGHPELKELLKNAPVDYNLLEACFPINPLWVERDNEIPNEQEIQWLRKWDSVADSVGYSVADSVRDSVANSVADSVAESVGYSVGYSVADSVGYSVAASVRDSVADSVGYSVGNSFRSSIYAYISSLFPEIKTWKYVEHEKGVNPFQPAINLWKAGLVPSFDSKTWRLHVGENAEIVYAISNE